jgi:uncharacterized protein
MTGHRPAQLPDSLNTTIGTLHGMLEVPAAQGPVPVVLIIAGYGPTGRDGNASALVLRTDSYTLPAAALSKHGIASSRYEKRGAGEDAVLGLFEDRLRLKNFV